MPWICQNPFFILELPPSATRGEIERKAQKLLFMLEMGFAEIACYSTPLGQFPRTAENIRHSLVVLRDPKQRIIYEFWAQHGATLNALAPPKPSIQEVKIQWDKAFQALGWRCL